MGRRMRAIWRDDRLARFATLAAATALVLVLSSAEGDAFRLVRQTWETSESVRNAAAALAIWGVAWLVDSQLPLASWRPGWARVWNRAWRALGWPVAVGAAIFSLGLLGYALRWGLRLDAPMVLYPARLFITGQRLFYRDLVEFNQPATYVLYGLMDRLIGSEVGYRVVDASLVVISGVAARRAFRLRQPAAAPIAVALFVVTHLYATGVDCLQREMFVLALSMLTGAQLSRGRWALAAACATFAFWMKFHAALLFAPFVWDALQRTSAPVARRGLATFVGILVGSSVAIVLALAACGALPAWLEMVGEYLPLYGRMSGTWNFSVDASNLWTRRMWLFLQPSTHAPILGVLLIPPVLLRAFRRGAARESSAGPAIGFYLGSLAYVLIQGTFWHYQSIPEFFAIGILCAILVTDLPDRAPLSLVPRVALAGLVAYPIAGPSAWNAIAWDATGQNDEAVAMAEELRAEVPPGETVQPLETVTGAVDAMWRADVPMATPFVFDIVFYYRPDLPVIRRWRQRFLDELDRSRPYFILESTGGYRARPYGPGSDNTFPELDAWIRANYDDYRDQGSFRWWRRRAR